MRLRQTAVGNTDTHGPTMRTVLVASRDQATRSAVRTILCEKGFNVVMASDAARARTVLEDNPQISGVVAGATLSTERDERLVAHLRADARYQDLPIIVVGASARVGEVLTVLEQGASRYVANRALETALAEEIDAVLML